MLKVVLVEDESFIREGIRDTVPWEQYGYEFVGEAADGEMALSVIRKMRPDVLITDIKMPFMDGLSLCKIVREEFPKLKTIIISGYDDFEYARQAIALGVDQYLLKPITKTNIKNVLLELKDKIEQDMEQQDYQAQFNSEFHEYENFGRRRFFERMLEGELTVKEIYDEATKLSLEIMASKYNLLFFYSQEKNSNMTEAQRDDFARKQDEVLQYLLRNPQYILFGWNVNSYGILLLSDENQMETLVEKCVDKVKEICMSPGTELEWYLAVGEPVERLSMLPGCYQLVNRYFAYRFILPGQHILTSDTLKEHLNASEERNIKTVDSAQMDPEVIKDFLTKGSNSETVDFVESYLMGIREALASRMFRDYVVLNIRFTILAYVGALGASEAEHASLLTHPVSDMNLKPEEVDGYFVDMLQAALQIRDRKSDDLSGKVLHKAIAYMDENYDQEAISLNSVAAAVNVSANYLSATFSQSMQKTFVEYITEKRMDKAKRLLRSTDKTSGEIALEVGYKDPHYFSFVFKKTQGTSPREYRNKKN